MSQVQGFKNHNSTTASGNKDIMNSSAEVFVRNFAKAAVKLVLPSKISMREFEILVSKRMNVQQKNLVLFLQGKMLQSDEISIDFCSGMIFHAINMERVNVSQICIYIKRIQSNAQIHKFIIPSQLQIQQFIFTKLNEKYNHIENYFLVYAGRQLLGRKTFREEYVESGAEILIIHRVENLKKQNITVSKENSRMSFNKGRDKVEKEGKTQIISNSTADRGILNQINQTKVTYMNENNGQVKKIQRPSQKSQQAQIPERKHNQDEIKPQQQTKREVTKLGKKIEQEYSESDEGSMPQSLYETAKFNSVEQMKSSDLFSKKSNTSKKSEEEAIQKDEGNADEQLTEQIVIGNNKAYSLNIQSKCETISPPYSIQENKSQNQGRGKIQSKNPITTKYGLAPSKPRTQFKRSTQQNTKKNEELEGIYILSQDSENDGFTVDLGNQDQYMREEVLADIENRQEEKNKINPEKLAIHPRMLATISSRYDQEEMYAMDSLNIHSTPNSVQQKQSQEGMAGSKHSQHKMKGSDYKLIKNMTLTKSYDLNENLKYEEVEEYPIEANQKINEINQSRENNSEEQQVVKSFKNQQNQGEIAQENELDQRQLLMKKRKNRVEVKDMMQTVSPAFFKPPSPSSQQQHQQVSNKNPIFMIFPDQYNESNEEAISEDEESSDKKLGSQDIQKKLQPKSSEAVKTKQRIRKTFSNPVVQEYQGNKSRQLDGAKQAKESEQSKIQIALFDSVTTNNLSKEGEINSYMKNNKNLTSQLTKNTKSEVKQQIVDNAVDISSTYRPMTESHTTNVYPIQNLPNPLNLRDSFTSDVRDSKTKHQAFDKLSIGSIQSETLFMMQLPEHSPSQIPSKKTQDLIQNGINYSYSQSESNYENILGSEASINSDTRHDPKQEFLIENEDKDITCNDYSGMKKKNKPEEINNLISSTIMKKNKGAIQQVNEKELALSCFKKPDHHNGQQHQIIEKYGEQIRDSLTDLLVSKLKSKDQSYTSFQTLKQRGHLESRQRDLKKEDDNLLQNSQNRFNKLKNKKPLDVKRNEDNLLYYLPDQPPSSSSDLLSERNLQQLELNISNTQSKQVNKVAEKTSFSLAAKIPLQMQQKVNINIGDMIIVTSALALYPFKYGQNEKEYKQLNLNTPVQNYTESLRLELFAQFQRLQSQQTNQIQRFPNSYLINTPQQHLQKSPMQPEQQEQNLLMNYL